MSLKRVVDLSLVLGTSPAWLPILGVAAAAVALDSRGPVIFSQKRMGWRERAFTVYKLRTMDPSRAAQEGILFDGWTYADDPRVTRIGRILRRYRIDELPQLVNVLLGEMSLVGPRPEPWDIAQTLGQEIEGYHVRHEVLPGLTGLCQISPIYSDLGTIEKSAAKAQLDLDYVARQSLLLDASILVKTVGVIFGGRGIT